MRLSVILFLSPALAAYSGDIVSFWNSEASRALPASEHGAYGLTGVMEGWSQGYIHGAIVTAAEAAASESRAVQQIAVSHAAHNAITAIFPTNKADLDAVLLKTLAQIGAAAEEAGKGREIGEEAATKVAKERAGDGATKFVEYKWKAPEVGVYQPTPPKNPIPQSPQAAFIKPFGGVEKVPLWKAPPAPDSEGYEEELIFVRDKGGMKPGTRTEEETKVGHFWLESSTTRWNRIARLVVGEKLKDNVVESARLFAKVNFAFANAGFTVWVSKYHYNSWRPVTALRWDGIFLASGKNVTDHTWDSMQHTPTHPEYLSGHAGFGAAAGRILQKYLGGDKLEPPVSITTHTELGMMTRSYDSLEKAMIENGVSRVYVGAHFKFASDEGVLAGYQAAEEVWKNFEAGAKRL